MYDIRTVNYLRLVSPLILLGAIGSATLADSIKPTYLPIESSFTSTGALGNSGIWDLSGINTWSVIGAPNFTECDDAFGSFSMDGAVKLGLSNVTIGASANYSMLFVESRRYHRYAATLKLIPAEGASLKKDTFNASALVGCACRIKMVSKGGELSAALTNNTIRAKFKAISETMSFAAIGFTVYVPFQLFVTEDGLIDLAQTRTNLVDVFNKYVKAAGNVRENVYPEILGFEVPSDFPRLADIASIEVAIN